MTTDPQTARYRHRTTEVEAVQWTGTNADALRAFAGADFDEIELDDRVDDPDETAAVREADHGTWRGLKPGDWVVKLDGGLYEFSAADFASQYEAVSSAVAQSAPAETPLPAADQAADEAYRLALSTALGLGTGATWEAIRDRAEDLTAEVEQLTETSRRLLEQRQEMAAERFVWQERGDRAEAAIERVRYLHDNLDAETALTSPDDEITRGAAARKIAAALDGYTPPAAAPAVSPVGQAAHTTRSAALREAADALDGLTQETAAADMTMPEGRWRAGLDAGIRELRRMADDACDEQEAQASLDRLAEDVCRPVEIGGETIRVHGAAEMGTEARAALAEVTAIVKRRMADETQPVEAPDVVAAIMAALQERAGELSELAEEQMRPSLEERAQEWHEAADVARRAAKAAAAAPAKEAPTPFTPPAHYRRDDGVDCCVHTIPVGPDSCPACRELHDDEPPAVGAQQPKEA